MLLCQNCATNKHHFDHFSVQVVLISLVNLAQACCQFQGLLNIEAQVAHSTT